MRGVRACNEGVVPGYENIADGLLLLNTEETVLANELADPTPFSRSPESAVCKSSSSGDGAILPAALFPAAVLLLSKPFWPAGGCLSFGESDSTTEELATNE